MAARGAERADQSEDPGNHQCKTDVTKKLFLQSEQETSWLENLRECLAEPSASCQASGIGNGLEGGRAWLTVGNGAYAYEPVENWAKLPPGWSFKEIGGVGVDRNDNVYVFNRGEHPMIVFDRDGNFLRSFGRRAVSRARTACSWRRTTRSG